MLAITRFQNLPLPQVPSYLSCEHQVGHPSKFTPRLLNEVSQRIAAAQDMEAATLAAQLLTELPGWPERQLHLLDERASPLVGQQWQFGEPNARLPPVRLSVSDQGGRLCFGAVDLTGAQFDEARARLGNAEPGSLYQAALDAVFGCGYAEFDGLQCSIRPGHECELEGTVQRLREATARALLISRSPCVVEQVGRMRDELLELTCPHADGVIIGTQSTSVLAAVEALLLVNPEGRRRAMWGVATRSGCDYNTLKARFDGSGHLIEGQRGCVQPSHLLELLDRATLGEPCNQAALDAFAQRHQLKFGTLSAYN